VRRPLATALPNSQGIEALSQLFGRHESSRVTCRHESCRAYGNRLPELLGLTVRHRNERLNAVQRRISQL
jgi:hypothetical protein